MSPRRVAVVGGGAAGFFAAITCAEAAPNAQVLVLERGPQFLSKVRISGGGRCNVTHACFDALELAARLPRGGPALIGPFQRFQASDTVVWFEARGVKLKVESDGRMFPVSDSSQTVIDCLLRAAKEANVKLLRNRGVERVARRTGGGFELWLSTLGSFDEPTHPQPLPRGEQNRGRATAVPLPGGVEGGFMVPMRDPGIVEATHVLERRSPLRRERVDPSQRAAAEIGAPMVCDRLLLATGGCRAPAAGQLAVSLGHSLEPPVPSLFTFHIATPWLRNLAGVSVESVEASVGGVRLRERGALLVTHWGLSGPVILRLSAWGARELHESNYQFPLNINWLPHLDREAISAELDSRRRAQPARAIVNSPIPPLPGRLWEQLVLAAGVARDTRWAVLARAAQHRLVQQLVRSEFQVTGKSLNKEEFVTCGGVRLGEVNFKSMESRICPGLYFAGELLDIDGITGGFNFQAAWTTGWIAGQAMAADG